jgi:hypothetical protein
VNFVRIGEKVVNLANITQIEPMTYDNRACIRINYVGNSYERIYSNEQGYDELLAWMSEQPRLEELEETGTADYRTVISASLTALTEQGGYMDLLTTDYLAVISASLTALTEQGGYMDLLTTELEALRPIANFLHAIADNQ